ncbi:MAG TPA: BTAD domain-containing putative transcriptional regulator, partial [Anaerolineae bacterium]
MTKVLKLALLGQLKLAYDDAPLAGLASGKAQALLCYLAVDGRPHSRQALAGLLWGELPEADARRNLRGALLKLRQVAEPHLLISHQTLAFDSDSEYWLDVAIFRRCLESRSGAPTPAQLRQAVSLYRGDFLEDFYVRQAPAFEEWVARQRAQLQELAVQAYQTLAQVGSEQGDYLAAIEDVRRALEIDPVREEAQRQLMQLLALSGQRSRALAQYETCRDILMAELSVAPAAETTELYERIRSGEVSRGAGEQGSRGAITSPGHPVTPAPKQPQVPHPRTPAPLHLRPPASSDDPPPFIAGPPITHPARFFGREYELKRLFNLFRRLPLQNAAVIGP